MFPLLWLPVTIIRISEAFQGSEWCLCGWDVETGPVCLSSWLFQKVQPWANHLVCLPPPWSRGDNVSSAWHLCLNDIEHLGFKIPRMNHIHRCDPHLCFPESFAKGQISPITLGIIKNNSIAVWSYSTFIDVHEVRTSNTRSKSFTLFLLWNRMSPALTDP